MSICVCGRQWEMFAFLNVPNVLYPPPFLGKLLTFLEDGGKPSKRGARKQRRDVSGAFKSSYEPALLSSGLAPTEQQGCFQMLSVSPLQLLAGATGRCLLRSALHLHPQRELGGSLPPTLPCSKSPADAQCTEIRQIRNASPPLGHTVPFEMPYLPQLAARWPFVTSTPHGTCLSMLELFATHAEARNLPIWPSQSAE
jgi:hypothetical protein